MCFLAFSHQYLHNFSFQSHRLLFSHASAEVRGENTPEKKVASTGDRTHNHQVMSPTRSPLSHPGGAVLTLYCFVFKGGYLDFSHLSELKYIYITKIYMQKNHRIREKYFDGVPLKATYPLKLFLDFAPEKKKKNIAGKSSD